MRKGKLIVIILFIMVFLAGTSINSNRNIKLYETDTKVISNNRQINTTEVNEQPYYDLFITMLYPYVEDAISTFYDEYIKYLPGEAPYSYKFTKIEKTPGLNYSFTIELEVQPYVGPHLSVGRDRINFKIDLDGVKLEKFEHIESYDLPPHYQNILKKKLPNT